MLRKILCFFISVASVFIISLNAVAFEANDLYSYNAIAIKILTPTDTIQPDKKQTLQITGTKDLEKVLGTSKKEFYTNYVYIGDKEITEYDTSKWYYYYQPSWHGRGRGKLNYKRNKITESGKEGDTLFVARKNNDEILFLITKKGSDSEQQIYAALGIDRKEETKQTSFLENLFGNREEKANDLSAPVPAVISDKKWIEIYFTPGTDCENNIIEEINNAKKMDIAVYSITNQKIVNAIIAAKERGAKIRVITDRLQSKGKYSMVDEIEASGITVVKNTGHKIMHNKFAIFDNKRVVTGSYNWTENATKSNAENCIFFEQPDKTYSIKFNELWDFYTKE